MSYDITLNDPIEGEPLPINHGMRGGTYCIGGSREAWLNITYNYAPHFQSMGEDGIRTIYGMTGAESISLLKKTIEQLGDDLSENYWEATEGNAKRALLQLVALAKMRPDGVWDGD